MMTERSKAPDRELALIVGAARSGTTLLRLIVDAHPEIGCPAEAGIPGMVSSLGRLWSTISGGASSAQNPLELDVEADEKNPSEANTSSFSELPEAAYQSIREAALAPMAHYCEPSHKRMYCDKSLDSVHHLELVQRLFPRMRCVLVFRHVMDTVASGLEASPWGFQAYGYAPYVQASPHNFVAALVSYWLTHVDQALRWEAEHPEACHRVRYEDFVSAPEQTVAGVFDFLGVAPDLSVVDRAFDRGRATSGPGDHKVAHTTEVHSSSVGRGKRVPVAMIPAPLLEAVNEKLQSLGYDVLDATWNAEQRANAAPVVTVWTQRLAGLMRDVRLSASANGCSLGLFAIVAEDNPRLRWIIDPTSRNVIQGDGEVETVVIGTTEDLALMIAREENLGVLLRSGRIRHLTGDEGVPPAQVVETMGRVLELLTSRHERIADEPATTNGKP